MRGGVELTDVPGFVGVEPHHLDVLCVEWYHDAYVSVAGKCSVDSVRSSAVSRNHLVVVPAAILGRVGDLVDRVTLVVEVDAVTGRRSEQEACEACVGVHRRRVVADGPVSLADELSRGPVALEQGVDDIAVVALVEYRGPGLHQYWGREKRGDRSLHGRIASPPSYTRQRRVVLRADRIHCR
jgi:hypothetical protein